MSQELYAFCHMQILSDAVLTLAVSYRNYIGYLTENKTDR